MKIFFLKLILPFLVLNHYAKDKVINELVLQEDENIKITLFYFSKANIGDSDWLKIEIENKTDFEVQIVDVNYYLNEEKQLENGEKYVDVGKFGQGNKYDLIHYFYDLPNSSNYQDGAVISPKSSIIAWKYLTNYASVLVDSRNISENKVCALFQLDFRYRLNREVLQLVCENKPFCFEWIHSNFVEEEKLEKRLHEILLNPHYRWVNTYVTKKLMNKDNIVKNISTDDLIQGVLLREDVMNEDENILFLAEVAKRDASPSKKLTTSFKRRIDSGNFSALRELPFYWDNALLDNLLNANYSSLFLVHTILEVHAKSWSSNAENTEKVYQYLSDYLNFERTENLQLEKTSDWAKNIKLIATSRNRAFINYLVKYLDDETEYLVENQSKYSRHCISPRHPKADTITSRVCDAAFVALLRALNQFEFEPNSNTKYHSLTISAEILPSEMIERLRNNCWLNRNNINLNLFEQEIKLTPELRQQVKEIIKTYNSK